MLARLDKFSNECSDEDREKCEFIKLCLRPDPAWFSSLQWKISIFKKFESKTKNLFRKILKFFNYRGSHENFTKKYHTQSSSTYHWMMLNSSVVNFLYNFSDNRNFLWKLICQKNFSLFQSSSFLQIWKILKTGKQHNDQMQKASRGMRRCSLFPSCEFWPPTQSSSTRTFTRERESTHSITSSKNTKKRMTTILAGWAFFCSISQSSKKFFILSN